MSSSNSKSVALVGAIIGSALVLSIFSYVYSSTASSHILKLASDDTRSAARIQARDLSVALANKVESVSTNLEILADAPMIQDQNVQGAIPLFDAARRSTGDFASSYFWVDLDGKLLWADAFTNRTIEQQYAGGDRSTRDYYLKPKENLQPYYTTVIESVDSVPRLYIGYPIIGGKAVVQGAPSVSDGELFKGVIVASINLDTLGKYVQSQLASEYESTTGLLDRNGIILYSSSSAELSGKDIFDSELQSQIPDEIKSQFDSLIRDSLKGETGDADITFQGDTTTLAYTPVRIHGTDFAILYIVTPHELAESTITLLEQLRILNVIMVVAIASVSATVSTVVLVWNKRLSRAIDTKTSELKLSNESLAESNRQLASANKLLEEANEQLRVHDNLQKEFVNVAAHELRTPIQPLLGAAELLESQFRDKDKIEVTRQEVEMILRNAKRLERLSNDILQISRIESGALQLRRENFSLAYIIADAVKDAKTQSIFDPGRLTITYYPDDIFVNADREKITEVVTNLLTNAIKFTSDGQITITTKKQDEKKIESEMKKRLASVTIRDTGTGIDPEIQPRIFEKFVTKSERGTGIGLYISKKIVEAHGGTIEGRNNTDGPGATFTFTVPLVENEEQYAPIVKEGPREVQKHEDDRLEKNSIDPNDLGVGSN